MRKRLLIAAVVLVAGFILAVVLENLAQQYELGPFSDAATTAPDAENTAGPSSPPGTVDGAGPPPHAQPMRTTFVWDGDTIQLQADESGEIVTSLAKIPVRLVGVDTPEIESQQRDEPSECYGEEATEFLRELIPEGTPVLVDRDRSGWDDFDRRLLYVWRAEDNLFVNYELVAQGYGEAIRVWPNVAYWDDLEAAQKQAEKEDRGMWGAC